MHFKYEHHHILRYKNSNIFEKHKIFILSNCDKSVDAYLIYCQNGIKNLKTNLPNSVKYIKYCYYTKIIMPNSVKFCEKPENIFMLTQQHINKNTILYVENNKNNKKYKMTKIKTKLTNIIFVNTVTLCSTLKHNMSLLKNLFIKIESINNLQIVDTNFQNFYFNLFVFLKNINKIEFIRCQQIDTIILKNIDILFFQYCHELNGQIYLKNVHLLKFNDKQYVFNLIDEWLKYVHNFL